MTMQTIVKPDEVLQNLRHTLDPFGALTSCLEVQKAWLEHPSQLTMELSKLTADFSALNVWHRACGIGYHPDLVPPHSYDERFQDPAWTENACLDTVKETYLLYVRWLVDAIYHTPSLPDKTRNRAAFWVREALNATAPTNYFWTNPGAMTRAIKTNGKSVLDGMQNFFSDLGKGEVSMVDARKFQVGGNLATTPGAVVFRNELIELIQYQAVTPEVHEIPIVIMAPWINKYYILDLTEKNSLLSYLVKQGFTVFVSSWKNPNEDMRDVSFDDYMLKGIVAPLEAVKDICNTEQVHLTGWCIGGTLVSAYLAWQNAQKNSPSDTPVAHSTLITTLVDFTDVGDIDVFIDEDSIEYLEKLMENSGYLDGKSMGQTFRSLRANSLIWYYWVHNYLYGEPIPAWDVLFWNTDNTRLPQRMHSYYLREFYLKNKLAEKNGITLAGRKLDMSKVTQPMYIVGTEQDHITPWKSAFRTCYLVGGPVRFVLATSGHILGVLSPPVDPPKRRYWVSDMDKPMTPADWQNGTEKVPGSWWVDWVNWLRPKCGNNINPPALGSKKFPKLADAPGTYVLEK
jgi:polyhydroxyalkanoate synthase